MGFFRWLFGLEEKKVLTNQVDSQTVLQPANQTTQSRSIPQPTVQKKPMYRSVARTQESNTYVKDILRKANSKDTTATPYADNKTDTTEIERLTNRLKAEYTNKK